MSPWQKNVSSGFNSIIVLPSPAFARKVAESNVLRFSLIKMLPRCRPVVCVDGSCPGSSHSSVRFLGVWRTDQRPRTQCSREEVPISLCDSALATQPRIVPRGSAQHGNSPPQTNRNYDQSLSIIARTQSGGLVCIAHFWRCAQGPAKLSPASWGPSQPLPPFRGTPSRDSPAAVKLGETMEDYLGELWRSF